jgi:hypothetical protein
MSRFESAAMQPWELGKYVCVAPGGCRQHSRDVNADGVWVKTGQQWSSAHRACFEAAVSEEATECLCGDAQKAHDVGIGVCDDCDCQAYRPANPGEGKS